MRNVQAAEVNQFERHGRAVKVGRLLRALPPIVADIMPGADDGEIAAWLGRLAAADRGRVAVLAGVKPPSDETWRAFVEAVRTRGLEDYGEDPTC